MAATDGKSAHGASETADEERLYVVRKSTWASHLATAVIAIFCLLTMSAAYVSPHIDHAVVGEYLLNREILIGTSQTVYLTMAAMTLSILLGGVLAAMRQSGATGLRLVAGAYIWFFRGTPVLVQIVIFFNIGLVFPQFAISVPFVGTFIGPYETNSLMTPLVAALLGLALNEAAYMGEIFRSGLLGVSRGECEAARALGMHELQVWRRVVIPQVVRIVLPATGNEFITMLKSTALVSVVAYGELMTTATRIYTTNARVIELLIVACFWYLVLTTLLTIIQYRLERHFGSVGSMGKAHGN